jgi:hypothetical protein
MPVLPSLHVFAQSVLSFSALFSNQTRSQGNVYVGMTFRARYKPNCAACCKHYAVPSKPFAPIIIMELGMMDRNFSSCKDYPVLEPIVKTRML